MNTIFEEQALGRLKKIGSGGQAGIYAVEDLVLDGEKGNLIYKKYKSAILKQDGSAIRHGMPVLLKIPASLSESDRKTLLTITVWPRSLITENDRALGILMRRIKEPFYFSMTTPRGAKATLLESVNFLRPDDDQARYGVPSTSPRQLALLVARLALCLKFFHEHGLVVGDFSPKNIAVTNPTRFKDELHPKFLDIDSFRISGGVPPLDQGSTPGWFAPETKAAEDRIASLRQSGAGVAEIARASSQAKILSKTTDVFKFGLLTMRLFHDGDRLSAYILRRETEARMRKIFGSRVVTLRSCLDETPANRPTAAELAASFSR